MALSNPLDISITLNEPVSAPTQTQPKEAAKQPEAAAPSVFSIAYWQEYFDVTENEIVSKVKASLNPLTSDFERLIEQKVDLYGPLWVCFRAFSTMVMVPHCWRLVSTNQSTFDIQDIALALEFVFGAVLVFVAGFVLLNKCFGANVEVIRATAVYGYSFSVFVVAALGTLLPFHWIRFFFTFGAGVHSTLFLLRNFRSILEVQQNQTKMTSVMFIAGLQFLLTCLMYFFYLK